MVIASKFDPIAAVDAMLPHLIPAKPFAVYSEFVEVKGREGTGHGRWAGAQGAA